MKPRSGWGVALLTVGLTLQTIGFLLWFRQPVIYDAKQYLDLAMEVWFDGGLPRFCEVGLRTYLYPLLLAPFVRHWHLSIAQNCVCGLQLLAVVGLMIGLRRRLLPADRVHDLLLLFVTLLLPVLPAYGVALLTDLPAVVFIQASLLLLCELPDRPTRLSRLLSAAGAGVGLGLAVQLRPQYQHLFWPLALLAGAWSGGLTSRRGWLGAGVFVTLFLLPAAPTVRNNRAEHLPPNILPSRDLGTLVRYHLFLGLWLDRWSANPFPQSEFNAAMTQVIRHDVDLFDPPPLSAYLRLAVRDPQATLARWAKHVLFAFDKRDLFPYDHRPGKVWGNSIRLTNLVVLLASLATAARWGREAADGRRRRHAWLHGLLFAYLCITLAPIVAEERYTLALYPSALIYASAAFARRPTAP